MPSSRFLAQAALSLVLALRANAESHVIKFVNQCGYGSPALMYNGQNVLTSDTYTSNGPYSGIAYLQTGHCGANGENCTLLETTLINPACAGCGSSTDISLIPPHIYNVQTSFAYYNGCNGQGKTCSSASCTSVAFFTPTDYFAQVACEVNDVNLLVAFCADAAQFVPGSGTTPSSSASTSSPSTSSSTHSSKSSTRSPIATISRTVSGNKSLKHSSTPTPTAPPGNGGFSDTGCDEDGETTPPSTPSPTISYPGCDEDEETTPPPTSTPTISYPGCDETEEPVPPSTPTPTVSYPRSDPTQQTTPSSPPSVKPIPNSPPSSAPTTSPRRCRPRPTGLTAGVSAHTPNPNPATTLAPVDSGSDGGAGAIASPHRRRRRHTHRMHY